VSPAAGNNPRIPDEQSVNSSQVSGNCLIDGRIAVAVFWVDCATGTIIHHFGVDLFPFLTEEMS
jgi:hypothetical protein